MKTYHSGPVAAEISRDDDGWLHIENLTTEFPDDAQWFRDLWSAIGGQDTIGEETGAGRKLFIVFGRLIAEVCQSTDGEDCDEYFELAGVW